MFQAAVVGLGRIGMGYDYHCPDDSQILTHCSGFQAHPAYELVGAVDPDTLLRQAFERKFQKPAYADLVSLYREHSPEVLALAVPTRLHSPVLQDVLAWEPRLVICEKPFGVSLAEAESMVALAKAQHCILAVNYMRRTDPGVLDLQKRIAAGELGTIYKGTVWYSKGMLNNGSHFLSLLHFLLGDEFTAVEVLASGRSWNDSDPEPDWKVCISGAEIYFLAAKEEYYSFQQMEFVGSQGVVSYDLNGNIILRKTAGDPHFSDYTILGPPECLSGDFFRYQYHFLENVSQCLTSGAALLSGAGLAVELHAVLAELFALRTP